MTCRHLDTNSPAKVKKLIPYAVHFLSCLYGSFMDHNGENMSCKLFLGDGIERGGHSLDFLLKGFWCPKCDRKTKRDHGHCFPTTSDLQFRMSYSNFSIVDLHHIYLKFVFDESAEEVQVACVENISYILRHSTQELPHDLKAQWMRCLDYLFLNKKRSLREAFSQQMSCFVEGIVWGSLFVDGDAPNGRKDNTVLHKLKYALGTTRDPLILDTLLESVASVMNAVEMTDQLFLLSLITMVDQLDSCHMIIRINAARLIHRSCHIHSAGGIEKVLQKFVHLRDELYDHMCTRLVDRPILVREFAETVLGTDSVEFVKTMVPVVLPKLVILQKNEEKAFMALVELAKLVDMELIALVVNWLPKVLAYALVQDDSRVVSSVLEFYHSQTGSDNKEIFAAALPALLEELVCFLDSYASEEINNR